MTSCNNTPMAMMGSPPALFLASTLAFIALLITAAHARTLPDCSIIKATILATYGRHLSPPPPPISSPSTHQLTNNYGRATSHPPPPPKPATPKGQLGNIASPCAQGQSHPCNDCISMVTNYGRTPRSPPPPPKPASLSLPLHQTLEERSPSSHFVASA